MRNKIRVLLATYMVMIAIFVMTIIVAWLPDPAQWLCIIVMAIAFPIFMVFSER